jgi:hypothetical protein
VSDSSRVLVRHRMGSTAIKFCALLVSASLILVRSATRESWVSILGLYLSAKGVSWK